jgi:hypothetical protein
MSERPVLPGFDVAGDTNGEEDGVKTPPSDPEAPADPDQPGHRLRLNWTHLNGGGAPTGSGRISQSLTGGREKTVTVEVRKRRPGRG